MSGIETRLMRPNTVGELHGHVHYERESCKSNPPCTPLMTLEEFTFHREWQEVIRLSQFIWEGEVRKMAIKKIREFKRGREVFQGPHGDRSEWAGMIRHWYANYLKTGEL